MDPNRDAGLDALGEEFDLCIGDRDATIRPVDVFRIPAPALSFSVESQVATEDSVLRWRHTPFVCLDNSLVVGRRNPPLLKCGLGILL